MRQTKKVRYRTPFDNDHLRVEWVPVDWPDDAVAEVMAFRASMNPGDIFELVPLPDGTFDLIATGTGV